MSTELRQGSADVHICICGHDRLDHEHGPYCTLGACFVEGCDCPLYEEEVWVG